MQLVSHILRILRTRLLGRYLLVSSIIRTILTFETAIVQIIASNITTQWNMIEDDIGGHRGNEAERNQGSLHGS